MENREVINDVLVHLFNEIMELEEQAIITEEYKDIRKAVRYLTLAAPIMICILLKL